jgi:guanine deaminase
MSTHRRAFVVHGGTVVNAKGLKSLELLENHSVCVDANGRIVHVSGAEDAATSAFIASGADVIDARGKFVTPGLVDTHCHGPQYRNAGTGTDLPLLKWLEKYTFPTESQFCNVAFARDVYGKVVRRSLRNGTTTCCYFATIHAEATCAFADIVKAAGQRAFVGKVCMDRNSPATYVEASAERSLADATRVVDYIEQLNCPTVHAVLTPRFVPTCSSALMHGLGAIARERGTFVQSHISENVDEIKWVSSLHPDCPHYTDVYHRHGLLNARSVMAHAIYLSDEELALFRSTGASISHCPNSNFTICSGVLDVRRVLDAGVKLGLGTDVSGGYAPSMWDAIRMAIVASSVHSVTGQRPAEPLGYAEAFYLATLGGARALALGDEIGSLEVGKQFDALLIDPAAKHGPIDLFDGLSTSEVFQKIVFLCDDRNIERVFVCGVQIDPEAALSSATN